MQNKRKDPRLITLLPVGVKLFNKNDNEEISVFKLINLSNSGFSLITFARLAVGSEIQVKLKLPTPKGETLKGIARVHRCEEFPTQADHSKQFMCGLFLDLSPEAKSELERFINGAIKDGSALADRRGASRVRNGFQFSNPAKFHSFHLSHENSAIQIQQLSLKDLDELVTVEVEAWGKEMCATRAMLQSRLEHFQEGMIGARKEGKLLGYVGLMMINDAMCDKDFTWMGITDGGYIQATHNPSGNCLYGVSLSVIPAAPKDLAVKLLKAAGKLSVRKALKGILFGCRIPNFHKHSKRMGVEEYISATSSTGRILDPELSLYRQVNCLTVRPIPNYFEDPESLNYGVLVFFENPFYEIQRGEFPFFIKNVTVDFT
jgi:hypothetical protein